MRIIKYWLPTVLFMTLIFFLSSRQRLEISENMTVQFVFFKSLHMIEYGILYVLLYRSLRNTNNHSDWQNRADAFLLAVFYGLTDEIHQVFVPSREGRMRDIFIDAIGISLVSIYLWKYLPKAPKRLRSLAKKLQIL